MGRGFQYKTHLLCWEKGAEEGPKARLGSLRAMGIVLAKRPRRFGFGTARPLLLLRRTTVCRTVVEGHSTTTILLRPS